MKTDPELQQDILSALKSEQLFSGTDIGVSVELGVVTLSGSTRSDAIKIGVLDMVKNVPGVKAVIDTIQLKTDTTLAEKEDIVDLSCSSPINF